jgi:hypothetical protein
VIDWLSLRVSCQLSDSEFNRLNAGRVVFIDADGVEQYSVLKRLQVFGSMSSSVQIRAIDHTLIEISGNPAKFLNGHNLFGADHMRYFTLEFIHAVLAKNEISFEVLDTDVEIYRVDINKMYDLGSADAVQNYIRIFSLSATARNRGRVSDRHDGTAYIGDMRSKEWFGRLYNKQKEIQDHFPKSKRKMSAREFDNQRFELAKMQKLATMCEGTVRLEFVLLRRYLNDLRLGTLSGWRDEDVSIVFENLVKKISVPNNLVRHDSVLDSLSVRHRGAVDLWLAGRNIRDVMSSASAKRYRTEIKNLLGIDLFVPPLEPQFEKPGQCEPISHPSELREWIPTSDMRKIDFSTLN